MSLSEPSAPLSSRLATLLEGPLPITERERVIQEFHPITSELFLSAVHNEFSVNYVAKGGDSYEKIAKFAGISVNLLSAYAGKNWAWPTPMIGD